MNALVDRWVIALGILSALLAASVLASISLQQEGYRLLSTGFSGSSGSEEMLEYGRISAWYMLLNQVTPVLIVAAGLGVVALLVVLSRRWTALEELRVRQGADA